MAWSEHIKDLKTKWIGKQVEFENKVYNIVDVDYNGILHIDRETEHNKTTAVYEPWEAKQHLVEEARA